MHALRELPEVRADIAEAFNWYQDRRSGLGRAFAHTVKECFQQIRTAPLRNASRFDDIRRLNLGRFPYAIFYFMDNDAIIIAGVIHVRRDFRHILQTRRQQHD